jgi:hypothetical protein
VAAAATQLIADPFIGPVAALRYQPSAALERAVRCRDLTCRFPDCSRAAVVCDLTIRSRSTTTMRRPLAHGVGEPQMSVPTTSSTQAVRWPARQTIG